MVQLQSWQIHNQANTWVGSSRPWTGHFRPV